MSTSLRRRIFHGPPLALQVVGLLVTGLVVAQFVTLFLTLLLPPSPGSLYRLDDISAVLRGGNADDGQGRNLIRTIQNGPPDVKGPGWLTSERSRRDLATLLGVEDGEVLLSFYTPLPFAGTMVAAPPAEPTLQEQEALAPALSPTPTSWESSTEPLLIPTSDMAETAHLIPAGQIVLAQNGPPGGGMQRGGFPSAPGGTFPGGSFPGGSFPNGGQSGGGILGDRFPNGGTSGTRAPSPTMSRGQNFPRTPQQQRPDTAGQGGQGMQGRGGMPAGTSVQRPQSGSPAYPQQGQGNSASTPRNPALQGPVLTSPPGGRATTPRAPSILTGPMPPIWQFTDDSSGSVVQTGRKDQPVVPAEPQQTTPSARQSAPVVSGATPQLSTDPVPLPDPSSGAVVDQQESADSLADPTQKPIPLRPVQRGLFGFAPAPFVEGDFIAAWRMPDGRWSVVHPAPEGFPNSWQRRVLLWFAIALAIVIPLGWLFARRIVKPLHGFASAAEQLGRDPSAAILPLDGPAEVGRAANAFNLMQSRLRTFVDDRTAMIGAISHDLRTPLTRLRFRIEDVDDGDLRDGMIEEVEDMEAMINSVLEYIRDVSAPGTRERIDLGTIVAEAVEDARMVGRTVDLEIEDDALVEVDVLGIKRVVDNLIENAVKYGENAIVHVGIADGNAVAEIIDRGPGLPAGELESVFTPFYRTASAIASEKPGSGLGLAVCRSIARAHGGDVSLFNIEGGLMARVMIPLIYEEKRLKVA